MIIKKTISTLLLSTLLMPSAMTHAAETSQSIGNGAVVHKTTANADSPENDIAQILNFNFIKDKNYDKEILILKTSGTIHSGYQAPDPRQYNSSSLRWGAQYNVKVQVAGNDSTNIVNYAPKNQNESHEVTSTVGYGVGGNINVSNTLSGGANSSYNFSETVNYQQASYKTSLLKNTNLKNIGWEVEANKIYVNGYGPYTRALHYNERYGNELFLASRQGSVNAGQNFVHKSAMPVLARENFNPEFISVLTHQPSDNDKDTIINVTFERRTDKYQNFWNGFHWWGQNQKNFEKKSLVATYKINWKEHTATLQNTYIKN
ncbi:beta-channel forming cytolysin [Macrococcoides canis]|uniref:beta-channel forming cytolysin n=1 Tax=Macrococcoides canis TaxID=1855823 RepID=UPI00165D558F|nr:beta-channel forming cytolysin [Macrococcus canis]QNR06778.1 beta-channel forming cytolysin [Macrococcus canis]